MCKQTFPNQRHVRQRKLSDVTFLQCSILISHRVCSDYRESWSTETSDYDIPTVQHTRLSCCYNADSADVQERSSKQVCKLKMETNSLSSKLDHLFADVVPNGNYCLYSVPALANHDKALFTWRTADKQQCGSGHMRIRCTADCSQYGAVYWYALAYVRIYVYVWYTLLCYQ